MQLFTLRRLAVVCTFAFTAAAPFADAAEWTTYQGDVGHTGYVPETLIATETYLLWSANPQPRGVGGLVVSDGLLITTPMQNPVYQPQEPVVVTDAATGLTLWSVDFPNATLSPVTVDAGAMYFQTNYNYYTGVTPYVYSYTLDGTLLWKTPYASNGARYLAPVVADGAVFAGGGNSDGIYSFDAATGAVNWFTSLPQAEFWSPTWWRGKILVHTNELDVLDETTGAKQITMDDPTAYEFHHPAVMVVPPYAYVMKGAKLQAYDLNTRTIAWSRTISNAGQFWSEMATDGNELFVIDNGLLTSVDPSTGALLWYWRPAAPSTAVNSNVIVTLSHVIVSNMDHTYMISRDTHLTEKTLPVGGNNLAFGEGELFIASDFTGIVYAFGVTEEFTVSCPTVVCPTGR